MKEFAWASGVIRCRWRRTQDGVNMRFQDGDVNGDYIPHLIQVNAEIIVHEDVSHGTYLFPGNLRVGGLERVGEAPRGLPNDLVSGRRVGFMRS